MKYIMTINAGSSSVKFRLYDESNLKEICNALCERISIDGIFRINYFENEQEKSYEQKLTLKNHDDAVNCVLNKLIELKIISSLEDVTGVGHRVVQGGEISKSSIVDDKVLKIIEKCIKIAPLHNKPEYDVIKIVQNKMPNVKNVAVFDTSFHTTIPKVNSYYPLPKKWIDAYGIKKYGFHGTSYRYIYEKVSLILNKNRPLNLIVCHLGNGASVCCIKNGNSFDTTMGFSPMAGLIMGTRCGDIDTSILDYLINSENMNSIEVFNSLNKESGLKAICGLSDFRDISSNAIEGNDFHFAQEIFYQKIANYISLYINHLENEVDAIVFTGGIGENDFNSREKICEKVFIKKLSINPSKNKSKYDDYQLISSITSNVKIYAIKTNEELKIAQDTKELI